MYTDININAIVILGIKYGQYGKKQIINNPNIIDKNCIKFGLKYFLKFIRG